MGLYFAISWETYSLFFKRVFALLYSIVVIHQTPIEHPCWPGSKLVSDVVIFSEKDMVFGHEAGQSWS